MLGVSERTFRRWTRRYEEEGEAGLVDRRLGRASGRRVPCDRAEEVERLYRERYQGFTVKHFHEHLVKDHGFGWGYTWTKLHLQWAGLAPKAPRKAAIAALADRAHWLAVEWLPKYAPEFLNDIERDLKAHHLAHQTFTNADDLDHTIYAAVAALNTEPSVAQTENLCLGASASYLRRLPVGRDKRQNYRSRIFCFDEAVEERHGEGGVAVRRAIDHAL